MINPDLLEILRCPDNRQRLALADPSLVASLNERIAKGEISNRGGNCVIQQLDAGLVREDGAFLYPVRRNIPIMLIDEAIGLR
jgi:uncharacterized protein YbaR (Trm112 family)